MPVTPSKAGVPEPTAGQRPPHRLAVGPRAGDDVAEQVDRVIGRRRRLIGHAGVGELPAEGFDELPVGRGGQGREVGRREIDTLGQRAGAFDSLEPVAAEHRHRQPAAPRLAEHFLRLAPVARHDEELDPLRPGQTVQIGTDVGLVAEVGVDGLKLAAERGELLDEGLADAAAVLVVEIQHGAALEAESLAHPVRQRRAVGEVAGAHPEGVVAGGGDFGRGGRGGDRDHGIVAAVIHRRRGEGGAGEEVADDRGDPGVVQVVGDEDRGVGVGVVVPGVPAPAAGR